MEPCEIFNVLPIKMVVSYSTSFQSSLWLIARKYFVSKSNILVLAHSLNLFGMNQERFAVGSWHVIGARLKTSRN